MPSLRGRIVILALLCAYSAAQRLHASAKCRSGYEWMYNSLNQSPCDVAYELSSVCVSGRASDVLPLQYDYMYDGPAASYTNRCWCSSVYYSLLSGCAYCQGREFISWGWYSTNCTNRYHQVFPEPIPVGLKVQAWAYEDIENNGGTFNATLAQSLRGGVESTRLPTSTPTETTVSSSTSKVPVIVGVVVAIIGVALIIGLSAFFIIRRKKRRSGSSSTYKPALLHNPNSSDMGQSAKNFPATTLLSLPSAVGKPYNPYDPSTFPTTTSISSASSPDCQAFRKPSPLAQSPHPSYTPPERNISPPSSARKGPLPNSYLGATPEL